MKYQGTCSAQDIQFPVSFEVNDGRVENFAPPELEDKLYGAALLAHVNYQGLLKGITDQLPSSIVVTHHE